MAKLIRDRSTPEKDAWWSAVQDAAKTAPKLTYERSAAMASDDVFQLAKQLVYRLEDDEDFRGAEVVEALAAEVRELRRDKARLDWLCEQTGEGLLLHATRGGCEVEWSGYGLGTLGGTRTLRAAIDALMDGEAK